MEAYLLYLTSITVILVLGLFVALIGKKLRISNLLLLLITGIALSQIIYKGEKLFVFSETFLTTLAVLALVIVLFDSASRFRWKTVDEYTLKALKLALFFLVINMMLLSIATYFIFDIRNLFLVLIFSSIMVATSSDAVLGMLKNGKKKVADILRIESIVSTPFTILIPFILLSLMQTLNIDGMMFSTLIGQLMPFITQFAIGVGAGLLIGLIIAKVMKKAYSEKLSPLALVTAALLTYILAELLGGNGVLGVAVMGLMYGNIYVKQKEHMYTFSTLFENSLLILVFMLVGIVIKVPLIDWMFWAKAGILYMIYTVIRYISVHLALRKEGLSLREKWFMTLVIPKGIAVAVVAFALATNVASIPSLGQILDLIVAFMLISLVISTIASKSADSFLSGSK